MLKFIGGASRINKRLFSSMNQIKLRKLGSVSYKVPDQKEQECFTQKVPPKAKMANALSKEKITADVFRQTLALHTDICLQVCLGDISLEQSDAIVCPANNFLQMHGGVAACILQRGGRSILE